MNEFLTQLSDKVSTDGPAAAIDLLIEQLRSAKDFDALFDALLMKTRVEMGLPLVRPGALDNVPDDQIDAFKEKYISAARETGQALIDNGDLQRAWIYLRTINEPGPMRVALEAHKINSDDMDAIDEFIHLALYEGAHPAKGLELLLKTHGTCNTVTATDQQLANMSDADRQTVAAMLVNNIYSDLQRIIHSEVQQKQPMIAPDTSLFELIATRDWLFSEGNYHIDVSHLNSIVRFARALNADAEELPKALELAEYGRRLDDQFQYPSEPPFDKFYPAHIAYFQVIHGDEREAGLKYFNEQLQQVTEPDDKRMVAYVIVDLLLRIERTDEAVELAAEYLSELEDAQGFSFSEICDKYNRLDVLQKVAADRQDAVSFLAAIASGKS